MIKQPVDWIQQSSDSTIFLTPSAAKAFHTKVNILINMYCQLLYIAEYFVTKCSPFSFMSVSDVPLYTNPILKQIITTHTLTQLNTETHEYIVLNDSNLCLLFCCSNPTTWNNFLLPAYNYTKQPIQLSS